jgi:hypothetical protein
MKSLAAFALIGFGATSWAQEGPAPVLFSQGQVTGTLPIVLQLRSKSASVDGARLASMGPRRPTYVAPSAKAYGNSEFSALPSDLSFYAGLSEKPGPGSNRLLSAVEVRFVRGPTVLMALDASRGEVLVGPGMARKLHVHSEGGAPAALSPFSAGAVTFTGTPARLVNREELPGDSVDGVLPLRLFSGFRVSWDLQAGTLTLEPAGDSSGADRRPGAFTIPCQWPGGALGLEVALQGHVSGLMLVDASEPHSVLDLRAAENAGLAYRPWADVRRNEILKGGVADKALLRMGSAEVTLLSARVVAIEDRLPPGCLGLLGRDVLTLFDYSFEPGASSIVLTPHRADGKN